MIHFQLPSIPPSVNNAYITVRNKRILTKEGRAYKEETKTYIARHFPDALRIFSKEKQYVVIVRVAFPKDALFTKTTKAGSRYKKLDATNRIKLLEDAIAEATGIDDQQNFIFATVKDWTAGEPFTDVWVWVRYEEENPIDAFLRSG